MKQKKMVDKWSLYGTLFVSIVFIFSSCVAAQVSISNCSPMDCDDGNKCTKDYCGKTDCPFSDRL